MATWNGPFNDGLTDSSTGPNNAIEDDLYTCVVLADGKIHCNVYWDENEYSVCVSCAEADEVDSELKGECP